MTEEIKEILENLNTASEIFDYTLEPKQCTLLLDYITNLQQENERLKEDNLLIKSANKIVTDNLHNYKSRCKKAIEYIKEHWVIDEPIKFKNDLLNILNGSDEK